MPIKVVLFNFGEVTFNRNRRSKSIRLSVKPDMSVMVSYPWHVTDKEAARFVVKHEGWVLEQQQKLNLKRTNYNEGSEIKTKLFTVVFEKGEKNSLKADGTVARITVKDYQSEQSNVYIENALTHIYRYEAKKILPGRLKDLASIFGFRYTKVSIRDNRRNWGSCSSANHISLNLQMMKLPDELIDYILLHELVHTVIKNHGPEFWKKLDLVTNGRAKELAKQIKQYSTYTK